MSALDRQLEVSPSLPWGDAWLSRTLPSLQTGSLAVSYTLSLAIITLAFVACFRSRRVHQQIKEDPSGRTTLLKQLNKRLLSVSRGHFYVANLYLLAFFVIAGVDVYVASVSLRHDMKDHSDIWTTAFVLQLVCYMVGLCVLFVGVIVVVPFLQVCFAFWLLTRFARKHNANTLIRYIPQARAISTSMAQLWAMACFYIQVWTSDELGLWRWIVLEAAIGSAVAWLDASFAFNFCAHRLQDKELKLSSTGVRDVVAMFGETMKVMHAKDENAALLPKYEVVEQHTAGDDEKVMA